jgi:hypothetical protein
MSVFLLIANQWATGKQPMQNIFAYHKKARKMKLEEGEEYKFSSELQCGDYKLGLPREVLRELMMYPNLFVFPSKEESFGLVTPEMSLASGCLMVLNKSMQSQLEIAGMTALYFDFGSFSNKVVHENETNYCKDVANIIQGVMRENDGVMTKTWFRKRNNWDYLYKQYYAPIMGEAKTWI